MVKEGTDTLSGRKIPKQTKNVAEKNDGKHVVFEAHLRKWP